jgi:hypothetical protein
MKQHPMWWPTFKECLEVIPDYRSAKNKKLKAIIRKAALKAYRNASPETLWQSRRDIRK